MAEPHDPAPHACWQARVFGRVQGVGYRDACVRQATALGITGWVRNRADGSVEAMLEGRAEALARMHAWLHLGPPAAVVDRVELTELPDPGPTHHGFVRRPLA